MSPPLLLQVHGPLCRSDLPELYAHACARLTAAGARVLELEVSAVAPDGVALDALARLALAGRRHGCQVRLRGASAELWALIDLSGLHDVFEH